MEVARTASATQESLILETCKGVPLARVRGRVTLPDSPAREAQRDLAVRHLIQILVLDKSGSMSGSPTKQVNKALVYMGNHLTDQDNKVCAGSSGYG